MTDDPALRDVVARSTRDNVELMIGALRRPSLVRPLTLCAGARLEADTAARFGARIEALLRTYRIGQQAMTEHFLDVIEEGDPAEASLAVRQLRTATRTVHAYMEAVVPTVWRESTTTSATGWGRTPTARGCGWRRRCWRGRADSVVAPAPAGGWARGDESYKATLQHFVTMRDGLGAAAPNADAIMATDRGRRYATTFTTVNWEHIPADLLADQLRGVGASAPRPLDPTVPVIRGRGPRHP